MLDFYFEFLNFAAQFHIKNVTLCLSFFNYICMLFLWKIGIQRHRHQIANTWFSKCLQQSWLYKIKNCAMRNLTKVFHIDSRDIIYSRDTIILSGQLFYLTKTFSSKQKFYMTRQKSLILSNLNLASIFGRRTFLKWSRYMRW